MSAVAVLGESLLAVLAHRRWWILSLAGFLVRGGLLLLLVPLIPLPTTAALANALGPTLVGFVFGGPSASFLVFVGVIVGASLIWFVCSGIAGSVIDGVLIREASAHASLADRHLPTVGRFWTRLAVRWLAHVPTAAALIWGAATLVDAAYTELVSPGDPALPVALRVVLRAPTAVALVVAAWALGEATGGIAVRRVSWGAGIRRALASSVAGLLRPSGVAVFLVTSLGLAAAVGAGAIATGVAYDQARILLLDDGPLVAQLLALGMLSAAWIGTVVLVAIATAWRATAWTFETGRRHRGRTINPSAE